MMKTTGTVYVLNLDDMMLVRQAITAAKGYAKERLGEERAEEEMFQSASAARYVHSMLTVFEQKISEA